MRSATRAGYAVYSIDCFNDIDTQALTIKSFKLDLFTSQTLYEDIIDITDAIGTNNIDAIVIGSGFEHQIEIVEKLAKSFRVLANTHKALLNAKNYFAILDQLDIVYPQVAYADSDSNLDCLLKSISSAGGYDVKRNPEYESLSSDQYFQQYIQGELISVNFIANESSYHMFGLNQFWCVDEAQNDFRYSGAISHYQIQDYLKQQIETMVQKLSAALQLKGVCGLDFILTEDEQLYLIDINPRPTASFEFYDNDSGCIFESHLNAFLNNELITPQISDKQKGHQIVYSEKDFTLPKDFQWPDWTSCRTKSDAYVSKDEPICQVFAEIDVMTTLKRRNRQILNSL